MVIIDLFSSYKFRARQRWVHFFRPKFMTICCFWLLFFFFIWFVLIQNANQFFHKLTCEAKKNSRRNFINSWNEKVWNCVISKETTYSPRCFWNRNKIVQCLFNTTNANNLNICIYIIANELIFRSDLILFHGVNNIYTRKPHDSGKILCVCVCFLYSFGFRFFLFHKNNQQSYSGLGTWLYLNRYNVLWKSLI